MLVSNEFLQTLQRIKVFQSSNQRTVKSLIEDSNKDKIIVPPYQRTFVWDKPKQSRFVESLFLNVPVPAIFLLEKESPTGSGKIYEIVDGVQRVTTLKHFSNGILRLKGLDRLVELNEVDIKDLSDELLRHFFEQKLTVITIQSSETNPEIQYEIFERLNQGSVSLNAQELRNCMYHGEFNDFLNNLSEHPAYKEILKSFPKFKTPMDGKPDPNRMLDVEMILRFFTLYENSLLSSKGEYPPSKKGNLNRYMEDKTRVDGTSQFSLTEDELRLVFLTALENVRTVFRNKHFRNFTVKKQTAEFQSPLNKAVFDVQMLGLLGIESNKIKDNAEILYEAFLEVSSYEKDFISSLAASTDNTINLRVSIWKNKVAAVLEEPEKFRVILQNKERQYNRNAICHHCKGRIQSIAEADSKDNQLLHRWCVLETDTENKRSKRRSQILMTLGGKTDEFENLSDALDWFVYVLKNETSIENDVRLQRLDFVGTPEKLRAISNGTLSIKKLEGDLFISVNVRDKADTIEKMKEIASLFDFTRDFDIE